MKELLTFSKEFEKLWVNTKSIMKSENTLLNIERHFQNNQHLISNNNYIHLKKKFGIYIFYIKPYTKYTYASLCKDWNQPNYEKYPKVIQKTFEQYNSIDTNKWYPLYIGKCENLGQRLKEHITHSDKKSTYSLKLNGRSQFNSENIKYAYWELPDDIQTDTKEIKQFLITQLEHQLRKKLNPWIGKQ